MSETKNTGGIGPLPLLTETRRTSQKIRIPDHSCSVMKGAIIGHSTMSSANTPSRRGLLLRHPTLEFAVRNRDRLAAPQPCLLMKEIADLMLPTIEGAFHARYVICRSDSWEGCEVVLYSTVPQLGWPYSLPNFALRIDGIGPLNSLEHH